VYEYPVRRRRSVLPGAAAENAALYKRYEEDAEQLEDVTFVGRLATYKYYNMDQVVGQSLAAFKRLRKRHEQPEVLAQDRLPPTRVTCPANDSSANHAARAVGRAGVHGEPGGRQLSRPARGDRLCRSPR
jgi:hypothetical protein